MKTNYNDKIGLLQFSADYDEMLQILDRINLPELARGMKRYSFRETGSAGWYNGDLNGGIVNIALSTTNDNLGRGDITANITTIKNGSPDFKGLARLKQMKAHLDGINLESL